jgi:uncharacterized protein (DUF3084 family)
MTILTTANCNSDATFQQIIEPLTGNRFAVTLAGISMQLVSEKREARSEKREARSEKREARSEKREARSEKREKDSETESMCLYKNGQHIG